MLVVWTPLKNMSSSIGMIIPNIWENKKWQPNHQPEIMGWCCLYFSSRHFQEALPLRPASGLSGRLPGLLPLSLPRPLTTTDYFTPRPPPQKKKNTKSTEATEKCRFSRLVVDFRRLPVTPVTLEFWFSVGEAKAQTAPTRPKFHLQHCIGLKKVNNIQLSM